MGIEINIFKENLHDILAEYRKIRPNLSLRAIAKNIGVSRYFLKKIQEQGDCTKYDLDQILVFCHFMVKLGQLDETIVDKILEIKKNITRYFTPTIEEEGCLGDLHGSQVDLSDKNNFLIMMLAACDSGFSKEKIVSILGEGCESNIEYLLKCERIVETPEGTLRTPGGVSFYATASTVHFHLNNLLRFYNQNHRGEQRNLLKMTMQSLNKEAIQEIIGISDSYNKKILSIITHEKNWGPNPFFTLCCMDTLTDKLK